jgi:AAA family ATP:ADP antiporter
MLSLLCQSQYSKNNIIKMLLLGFCFFFIFGAYTLLKELKDAIFTIIVGYQYLPDAKAISLLLMIPMVLFYTWLSEKIKRNYLLSFYALFYGFGSIIIAYYIQDPIIGLNNIVASKYRIFGWIAYLFFEGLSPFLVSVNWSFLNSISKPTDIKSFYIGMAAMAKMGAVCFATLAWLFMNRSFTFLSSYSDVSLYVILLKFSAGALFFIPILLLYLIFKLPQSELQGYSDINETPKNIEIEKSEKKINFGFFSIFNNPYVLSIVGMIFFWEIVNVIFNNLRLIIAFSDTKEITQFSSFLFKSSAITNLISFLFVIIGTNSIIRFLGERRALLLIPLLTGSMMICFLFYKTTTMIIITWTIIRVINLSLSTPVRESLYIPTSKDIQFKSKSWIDSFGQKFSKGIGSIYNKLIQFIPNNIINLFQLSFFLLIITLWTMLAYYLGKQWQKAIDKKEIIQ